MDNRNIYRDGKGGGVGNMALKKNVVSRRRNELSTSNVKSGFGL